MLVALPPPAAVGRAVPPAPPGPPRARPEMRLTASPESPVRASDAEPAPVEAVAEALADAEAGPVLPLPPEAPDVAAPDVAAPDVAPPETARAVPRGAELMPVGLASAAPVAPVAPESPERAMGSVMAVAMALPVSPELVAEDCDEAAPVLPVVVRGATVVSAAPPGPPLASAVATELPPWARAGPAEPPTVTMLVAAPPPPALALARPASPPRPARAMTSRALLASPERPEAEVASDAAPVLAWAWAEVDTDAGPVAPEAPEPPVVALPPTARTVPRAT